MSISPRVSALRARSLSTPPRISLERAQLFTEAYRQHAQATPTPILRALAFFHFMENRTLYIGEDELIVGEKGPTPQTAPTFPELCCHTLDDLDIMDQRELISFQVDDAARATQRDDIIPFWQGRSMRDAIMSAQPPEWHDCYNAGLFTEFMEQRGPGHTGGGNGFYHKGFLAYKAEIKARLHALDTNDPTYTTQQDQLQAMAIACDAIILYGKRCRLYALALAETATGQRRADLLCIAHNCAQIPAHAPQTFHQALQMYWFVHIGVTTEINPWDAFTPGRLDQHLYPFYQADTAAGCLDDDTARELLGCLWVKFNNQPAPPKVGITLKESSTYTDFANINTGGITPEGIDGVNPLSYLILDVMDELQLLQPSSNVQISHHTPDAFLLKACEIARKGWGQPAFYNTEAIVQELINAGKSQTDAYGGGATGCVETGCLGKEAYILTGYMNLPKILELTLYNGQDPRTGKQLGLPLGHAADFMSYDALFAAFTQQLQCIVDIKIAGNQRIEALYAQRMPVPFLSIVTEDCITQGKDYNAGGARYNTMYIQGVGIGTLTDALAALQTAVYQERHVTMTALMAALQADFAGHDALLSFLRSGVPKYGNDDPQADAIMQQTFQAYHDAVTHRPSYKGGTYRIDMLPTTCHVYFGEVCGALPNGRKAWLPVSEGISPEKGADILGPTAVIRSAAKMDHFATGGTLLNQKFTPAALAGERGLSNLAALIRTYFAMGGHHIQFNVIDAQTLLDAQADPETHRDLIVRVAGYSDHFRNLSRALQNEIIGRTEQGF